MPTHYHYPDAIPVESFCSLIEDATLELQKSQHFLQRVESNPMLLFKEGSIYLKSTRNIVTSVMATSYLKNETITPHAFQVYLATVLDRAFKEWAKEQDLEHEVAVLVRQPNSFPSIFAVYVDEREVLQFNIFERWYGIRGKLYTVEELAEQYRKSEEKALPDIENSEKKLAYWKQVKEKPWTFIKSAKDVRILLFKRKTMNENIEKKISSIETQIATMKQNLTIQKEHIPELMKQQEKQVNISERMRVFFVELGYALNEERQQLY